MKRGRFSEEQIISVLKEAEAGAKIAELCRQYGISDAAFFTRRSKYGGFGSFGDAAGAPTRGREPAAEVDHGRPGAGYSSAQGRAGEKRLRPAVKRQLVVEVMTTHELSQRRACGLIGITRRGLKRAPAEDRNRGLRQRLRELAEERRRWGCPLLYLMLRREGWRANHKRVERLYREEGL